MNINLGKWGPALAGLFGVLSTVVTDSVLDAPDIVTILMALVSAGATVAAGIKSYRSDPNADKSKGSP